MLWLFLSILSAISIFIIFKVIDRTKAYLINVLIINYFIAAIIGFIYTKNFNIVELFNSLWFPISIIIGVLFIASFFILGISTNKVGISISTVASKMSVVITIVFTLIIFKEKISFIKTIAIILAFISIFLCVLKKNEGNVKIKKIYLLIPLILFIAMGVVDSLIVFSQGKYSELKNSFVSAKFTSTAFGFSFITGFIYTMLKPKKLKNYLDKKTIIYGTILGIINFGSIFFIIQTLNSEVLQKSVVYGIVNISCVVISVLLGWLFFKEKLKFINFLGVGIAIISLILLIL